MLLFQNLISWPPKLNSIVLSRGLFTAAVGAPPCPTGMTGKSSETAGWR